MSKDKPIANAQPHEAVTGEQADVGGDEQLTPIKIKRSTYRLVKTAAAWLGLSNLEYLDRVVRMAVVKDLATLSTDIMESGPQGRRRRGPVDEEE